MVDDGFRFLADRLRMRFRSVGDSGPGSCLTLLPLPGSPFVGFTRRDDGVAARDQRCWWSWVWWSSGITGVQILAGASATDVARRNGVARQTVHDWLRRYAGGGLAGLADRSSRPMSCPHRMPQQVKAGVLAMRRAHPVWGRSQIVWCLERDRVQPLPSRSAVHQTLLRHGLVDGTKRRRRADDRRWERGGRWGWQMEVMGRAFLAGGRTFLAADEAEVQIAGYYSTVTCAN